VTKQVIVRGPNLAEALHDLRIIAKAHDLEILVIAPLDGARGRPRAQVDFVSICDSLRDRISERGAIKRVALEYGVSPGWVYKWVVPIVRQDGALVDAA